MSEGEKFIARIEAWHDRDVREAEKAARTARNERLDSFLQEDFEEFLETEYKKLKLSPATERQYLGYLKRFMRFAGSLEFEGECGATVLPASPGLVHAWLFDELHAGATHAVLR
jgi:hypothetical protein